LSSPATLAVVPAMAAENPSPEALAVARELFAVTFERAGTEINARAVEHAWPGLEKALRASNPSLDAAAAAELRREFERIRLQKMRELVDAPSIYARHLSQDDMQTIMAFYRTPAGTKLMKEAPAIVGEIFAIALPNMPAVVSDTHQEFLELVRGYLK
jgi:cytochrome c553